MSYNRALTVEERRALTAVASQTDIRQTGISALFLVLYHGPEPVREAVRLLKMSDNMRKEIYVIYEFIESIIGGESLSDLEPATVNGIRGKFWEKSPDALDYNLEFYKRPRSERKEIDDTLAEVVTGIIQRLYTIPQLEAVISMFSGRKYNDMASPKPISSF